MSDEKLRLSRRDVFQLAVVGGAAAATQGCAERERRPIGAERKVQTTCGACAAGCGIVVRAVGPQSQDAVRITGLVGHPVNDGGMCPRGIAEIQNLYHPERLRGPVALDRATLKRAPVGWTEAFERLAKRGRGAEVVFGAGALSSAEHALARAVAASCGATVVDAGLCLGAAPVEALRAILGSPHWSFDLPRASFILSLGSDWLQAFPSPVEAQRAFATLRSAPRRGRLVTADARLSVTAARSDEWIPVARHQLPELALSIAHAMLKLDGDIARRSPSFSALAAEPRFAPAEAGKRLGIRPRLIERAAAELREDGVVVVDGADPAVQAAGIALDVLAGALAREGGLVPLRFPVLPKPLRDARPRESARFPQTRTPPVVILAGANPAQLALPESGWTAGLDRASFVVSLSSFLDETAARADLVLPISTPLEAKQLGWGCTLDGHAFVSAGPAAVKPLYDTLDWSEALLRVGRALGGELPWKDGGAYLQAVAETLSAQDLLKKGGAKAIEGGAPAATPADDPGAWAAQVLRRALARERPGAFPLELAVYVPLAFQGGSGAHLPYLHGIAHVGGRELWQTVVELHPDTARALRIADGSKVSVESARGRVRAVARVRQGIRPDSVAIAVGLGRKALGTFAAGHGSNPLDLLQSSEPAWVRVREAT
jgi:molybdopterin-containing oxidoreductase family iron-sulfur binding subunit